jgi:predicted amino acid-binding ACT domain protein
MNKIMTPSLIARRFATVVSENTTIVSSSSASAATGRINGTATSSTSSIWNQVKDIPIKYPFAFGVILSGFKTSFSDLLVQKVVERKENVDWKRNAAFAAFGFIYLGGVQYTLYVPVFGRLFPNAAQFAAKSLRHKLQDVRGMWQLLAQTFCDQCVHHPFMYFPAFYVTRELVMGPSNNESGKPEIGRVLSEYRRNMTEDLLALWKIWVPATLFNFAFMPMHLRIPFVAGVSLLWTCVLSAMRGGDVVHAHDMAGGAVTRSTYQILLEGLDTFNTTPVEVDPNLEHMNISAAGKQRPGLVALLARHIADYDGNVTHSKMVRLGEEFIIQMHVAVPKEQINNFRRSLRERKLKEFDIQATNLTRRATKKDAAVLGLRIHCVGEDRYV